MIVYKKKKKSPALNSKVEILNSFLVNFIILYVKFKNSNIILVQ